MMLNWVVVVMTHHNADRERQQWSQRSVIPVHSRHDAGVIAEVIRNAVDPSGEDYSTEVCVQIPAQKGNVLLTVYALEELVEEWERERTPKAIADAPRIGPKIHIKPKKAPWPLEAEEDEPA